MDVALIASLLALAGTAFSLIWQGRQSSKAQVAEHDHQRALEALRAELLGRARTEETTLRVRAETRLEMLKLALQSVSDAVAKLQEVSLLLAMISGSRNDFLAAREQRKAALRTLASAPPFLPPDLDTAFRSAANVMLDAINAPADESELVQQCQGAVAAAAEFSKSVRSWKAQQWELLDAPLALEPPLAQQAEPASHGTALPPDRAPRELGPGGRSASG